MIEVKLSDEAQAVLLIVAYLGGLGTSGRAAEILASKNLLAEKGREILEDSVDGNDPIEIVEQGKLVPGKRAHGCFCDKRMVLFSSAANFEKFKADQKRYETELQQALQSGKTLRR